MKTIVLGAGVIGVTTAYQLAKAGHQVTVIDRQAGPALETSFANAGQLSYGYSSPWAAPGIPAKALKWLFMEHAPLVLRPRLDAAMLGWLLRMLSNCTSERYAVNKSRMLHLAEYSREALGQLRSETGITYDGQSKGTLQLFRTQQQLDASAKDAKALEADGIEYRILSQTGCIEVEPALAHVRENVAGGLWTPKDETGDCYKFTSLLASAAAALGVQFQYSTTVLSLDIEGDAVRSVVTDQGARLASDRVVVALGSHSAKFLAAYNIRIPVYPVKGYSLTIPIDDETRAPVSTVLDESYKIAITRLGDRIRVGGLAEISGYSTRLTPARRRTLEHSVSQLFPGGDIGNSSYWCGLRPMTPDGTPIIGPTDLKGLFINTGHGTLGWTMSVGSARLLADLITRRQPEIEASNFSIARYSRSMR